MTTVDGFRALFLSAGLTWSLSGTAAGTPADVGMNAARLADIDRAVEQAIAAGDLPGAVVVVGRHGRVVFERAYGHRVLKPGGEAMTTDTVFDLASLTKVVATAVSVMQLAEDGKLRLQAPAADYLPAFGAHGKEKITVRQLLAHESGLRAGFVPQVVGELGGYDEALRRIYDDKPIAKPGTSLLYSDLNYLVLGELVARVSGEPLHDYARRHLYDPLGMRDTMYLPPESLRARIAPTDAGRGLVADGIARRMGGVAGHAGVFGTAADLAIFCRMLLGGGEVDGVRVLSPLAVRRLTTPQTETHVHGVRGLGFDIDTDFSGARGDLFPFGSFGHTGHSGTSIWLDPQTDTFVILLANRLHPDGKGDVRSLRAQIANIVAASIEDAPKTAAPASAVATGIDLLRADGFKLLHGNRVGLLTHRSAVASDGTTTLDVLRAAPQVTFAAVFTPEHGLNADLNGVVPSFRGLLNKSAQSPLSPAGRGGGEQRHAPSEDDKSAKPLSPSPPLSPPSTAPRTGVKGQGDFHHAAHELDDDLPIHSLYGKTLRPPPGMLKDTDVIVVDLVDAGSRYYTYMTTMAYMLEAAAKHRIPVVVLDRPNPVNGVAVEGPNPDADAPPFTNYFAMPMRHGLTLGELARLFNEENHLGADLTVVPVQGWQRAQWFDETGLAWVNPSPNLRNLTQATLYPGIGGIEGTAISVGRGTDSPFVQLGAPWIDAAKLAAQLNAREIAGIRFYPVAFTPTEPPYKGELCRGVHLLITDREALQPVRVGLEIAVALHRLFGDAYGLAKEPEIFGSRKVLERVLAGDDPAQIADSWRAQEDRWRALRAPYLLYP